MHGWFPLLVAGVVQLEGQASCPRVEDVALRLGALLPADADAPAAAPARARVVRLDDANGGLLLRLFDEQAVTVAERRLPAAGCADLALAAAVVIAGWQSSPPGEPPSTPVALLPGPRPPVDARGAAALQKDPEDHPGLPSLRVAPARRPRFDVGAAYVGSFAPGDGELFSSGARIELGISRPGHWIGGRFAVQGSLLRQLPVGAGLIGWTRAALSLGPRARFSTGRLQFDLHAEGALALVYLRGEDFATTAQSAMDVDPGAGGGAGLGVRLAGVTLIVDASVAGWLRQQNINVGGFMPASGSLPRLEVLLSAGFQVPDL